MGVGAIGTSDNANMAKATNVAFQVVTSVATWAAHAEMSNQTARMEFTYRIVEYCVPSSATMNASAPIAHMLIVWLDVCGQMKADTNNHKPRTALAILGGRLGFMALRLFGNGQQLVDVGLLSVRRFFALPAALSLDAIGSNLW
jgi:hypothetical protein